MESKEIIILIWDDQAEQVVPNVKNYLNRNHSLKEQLKTSIRNDEGEIIPYEIHLIENMITTKEELYQYLENNEAPNILLLDWQGDDDDRTVSKTEGEEILEKLTEAKRQSYLAYKEGEETIKDKHYMDMEIVVLSSHTKSPNYIEKMIVGGAVGLALKDDVTIDKNGFGNVLYGIIYDKFSGDENDKYPQLRIHATTRVKKGNRGKNASLLQELQNVFSLTRGYIEGRRDVRPILNQKFMHPNLMRLLKEQPALYSLFISMALGASQDELRNEVSHFNQKKGQIAKDYLDIKTEDHHLWLIMAIENKDPEVVEWLRERGFVLY